MANLTSTLTVRLLDKVTGPARNAARSLLGIKEASDMLNGRGGLQARLGRAWEQNNRALARAQGQMLGAVGGAYALKRSFDGVIGSAISFESAMADVGKVTNFNDRELEAYGKRLRKLATSEIPMAVGELAALSAAGAQSGVPEGDLFDFTRTTAKAAVAWEVSGAAAGEALAKIRTQLNLNAKATDLYADAVNHLSNNTASAAPDLLDYGKRVAAQGEIFGFAANETLALGAAMIASGAQADVAATSFRNMGRALSRGASATKRQRAAFAALGLDPETVAKSMQADAMGTTMDVMERLSALPAHRRASVMSDLFGDEARALAPMVNDLDLLRRTLGLVASETDYAGSVNEEFMRRTRTTEYTLQRLKNQLVEVGLVIGDALLPALRSAAEALGPVINKVSAFAERFPGLTRAVTLGTVGLIAFRIALIGVRWAALMARGGLLAAALPIVRLGAWARNAAAGAIALQGSLAAMSGLKFGPLAKAAAAFGGIARAIPIIGGFLVGGVSAPVVAGLTAIAAVGAVIYKYWDRISSFFSGVARALGEELAPALEYARPFFDWLAPVADAIAAGWDKATAALRSFFDWIGSFFSREVLSEEEKAGFEQAGYEAATRMIEAVKSAVMGLVEWFRSLPSRILSAVGNIDLASLIRWPSLPAWLGGESAKPAPAPIEQRAMGGPVRRGRAYLVGEEGPELAVFGGSGRIVPANETLALLRGMGGSSSQPAARSGGGATVNVNAPITITGVSDAKEAAQAVVRALSDQLGPALRGVHADVGIA